MRKRAEKILWQIIKEEIPTDERWACKSDIDFIEAALTAAVKEEREKCGKVDSLPDIYKDVVLPLARSIDYLVKYPDAKIFGFTAANLIENSIFAKALEHRERLAALLTEEK